MASTWTDDEKKMIAAAFTAICELHKQTPSDGLTTMYMRVLEPFSGQEVVRALEIAFTSSKFFPKPSELLDILNGGKEENALKAWLVFTNVIQRVGTHDSVLFEDARLCAVVKYFGGWDRVGAWLLTEMDFRRKEFIEVYVNMNNPPRSTLLPGTGTKIAALSMFPDLTGWAVIKKNGDVTRMVRKLADNGHDILDLPEPKYIMPALNPPPYNGNEKDLVPVTTVMKKIAAVFKDVPKEGEQY